MRILVMGGTRLVGRHIAQTALDRGHDVTLFNRGKSDPSALPNATHLTGHRNKDLSALEEGTWDATIDVSAYVHSQVRALLETLGERAGHYTFISTISVYGQDVPNRGFTEAAPLVEPDWADAPGLDNYGALKVACELAAKAGVPAGLLIVRPGYVIGPHDYSERFTHWVRAIAAKAPFEGPDAEQPLQCIDGRDLAAFIIGGIENGLTGEFNATAPQQPPTFSQVFDTIAAALDVELPEVMWRGEADDSLPLSAPRDWWPKMHADVSKAVDAGLTWRPLSTTIRDLADHIGL